MQMDTLYNIMELRQFIIKQKLTHYADIHAEFGWSDKTIAKYIRFIETHLYLLLDIQDGRNGYIKVDKDLRPKGYLSSKQLGFLVNQYEYSTGEDKKMYMEIILQFCDIPQEEIMSRLGLRR